MRLLVKFGFQAIPRAAGSVAIGIATLDHKARLDAVKDEAIVKAGFGQLDEGRRVYRGVVRKEREHHIALVGRDAHLRFAGAFGVFVELVGLRRYMWHSPGVVRVVPSNS